LWLKREYASLFGHITNKNIVSNAINVRDDFAPELAGLSVEDNHYIQILNYTVLCLEVSMFS